MTSEQRTYLKRAVSDARRAQLEPPHEYACRGCRRDLREDGYSLDCSPCWDRNRGRRRRGNPDGWRLIDTASARAVAQSANGAQWRFREAWLDSDSDPVFEPDYNAREAENRRRRQAAARARKRALVTAPTHQEQLAIITHMHTDA